MSAEPIWWILAGMGIGYVTVAIGVVIHTVIHNYDKPRR
jgi:hypothetical protein